MRTPGAINQPPPMWSPGQRHAQALLQQHRQETGQSLRDMAEVFGLSAPTIGDVINGQKPPGRKVLEKIAARFPAEAPLLMGLAQETAGPRRKPSPVTEVPRHYPGRPRDPVELSRDRALDAYMVAHPEHDRSDVSTALDWIMALVEDDAPRSVDWFFRQLSEHYPEHLERVRARTLSASESPTAEPDPKK